MHGRYHPALYTGGEVAKVGVDCMQQPCCGDWRSPVRVQNPEQQHGAGCTTAHPPHPCPATLHNRIYARWEHMISASYRAVSIIWLMALVMIVTHWVRYAAGPQGPR